MDKGSSSVTFKDIQILLGRSIGFVDFYFSFLFKLMITVSSLTYTAASFADSAVLNEKADALKTKSKFHTAKYHLDKFANSKTVRHYRYAT